MSVCVSMVCVCMVCVCGMCVVCMCVLRGRDVYMYVQWRVVSVCVRSGACEDKGRVSTKDVCQRGICAGEGVSM